MSPAAKMTQPIRTVSQDSVDGIRKRVCKACDRCRLKKSKCDGTSPCSRCRTDNAICVFGERKKSHDKVYPKGYVEMLEQQQGQLVSALQEMYRRLSAAQAWTGPSLSEANGHPLTHDILRALNLLETKHDGTGDAETFEEDCEKLQIKLLADGAGYVAPRRGSFSSDSDHSQHDQSRPVCKGTPQLSKHPVFRDSFDFNSVSPSPLSHSPVPRQRQSYPKAQPSPLQQASPLAHDPQFYQAEWTMPDMSNPEAMLRSKFALQAPDIHQSLSDFDSMTDSPFDAPPSMAYDANFGGLPLATSYPQLTGGYGGILQGMHDYNAPLDAMDLEFSKFIQVNS